MDAWQTARLEGLVLVDAGEIVGISDGEELLVVERYPDGPMPEALVAVVAAGLAARHTHRSPLELASQWAGLGQAAIWNNADAAAGVELSATTLDDLETALDQFGIERVAAVD